MADEILKKKRDRKTNLCEKCGEFLKTAKNLEVHMKRKHEPVRLDCDLCGKKFGALRNLKEHLRRHAGIKNHACTLCDKSFTRPGSLRTHVLLHTGVRPYTCNICEKTFTQPGNLKKHVATHVAPKVECEICNKKLHSRYMERHLKQHQGSKLYKCSLCESSYAYESSLRRHEHLHTLYKCHKCIMSFAAPGPLRRHLEDHEYEDEDDEETTYTPFSGKEFRAEETSELYLADILQLHDYEGPSTSYGTYNVLEATIVDEVVLNEVQNDDVNNI